MNNKSCKNGVITISIIAFVLLAILNVCTFAIPFPHNSEGIHYAAYGICEAMILISSFIAVYVLFIEENDNQKILAIPMVRIATIALAVQIVLTIIWYVLNAFLIIPGWVMAIVEVLVLGYFLIRLSLGLFFKRRNEDYHQNKADTSFIDQYRARLKALVEINKDDELERPLTDLYDKARGSDPIGNEATLQTETELLNKLMELDMAVKNVDKDNMKSLIANIDDLLSERNALCKTGK